VSAGAVADLLLELHARRRTILVVVTHSAALADRFPVRYEMAEGRLVESSPHRPNHGPRT
jgi:predicted ABC-type transport system involved in lysophospholipase L1 biosynthesis ATPase subunit